MKTRLPPRKQNPADQRNLVIAVVMSALLVVAWQIMVEIPKRQELAKWQALQEQKKVEAAQIEQAEKAAEAAAPATPKTREERLALSPRVGIHSGTLTGSVSLKGLRFDDLRLNKYHETRDPSSPTVILLSPAGGADAYFMQAGWLAEKDGPAVPDENSQWSADGRSVEPGKPVTFRWENGAGITYTVTAALDEDYMFTLTQGVENNSGGAISVSPYAFINRAYPDTGMHNYILHEGPLGVLDGALSEITYKELREEGPKTFDNAKGWLGVTDKYWLTALVPDKDSFKAGVSHYKSKEQDRYQAEVTHPALEISSGSRMQTHTRFFAGAKEIEALDAYAMGNADAGRAPIPLFDRAVDFGVLYFLTKPMFLLLNFFFTHAGNFGVAILLMTIVIKLLMFPLANKGYHATTAMRALQPEMAALKEKHGEDKVKMQQELIALYKREKVNPAAGCFPILVQIPVFFALYKVLFVTIEMRHAPFIGYLKDLSAPDPTNIFTLFGLIPIDLPPILHVGLLPILMGFTMWVQMRQQPKPTDPVQAKMISIMPYFLTFLLASMPAGLVLYWTWSNLLSIVQQWVITRKYNAAHPGHTVEP